MKMERKVKDITIVSLSRGILGESFVKHEVDLGIKRLSDYGIHVHFSKHALSGLDFIAKNPQCRAMDLLEAFKSDTDMILCAVGGDDTYRLLPHLFDNDELKNAVSDKIFLGFSDTTMNHFMLHKVGVNTFYGQAFLPDVCELGEHMLPYTRKYFEELITTGRIECITPAEVWYDSRQDFSVEALGSTLPQHANAGFELIQGSSVFSGPILGGCIDTVFDMFDGERYADSPMMCSKYRLFPNVDDFKEKILLLESSEEQATPDKYRRMIKAIGSTGIYEVISGILIGKPADEKYADEYKQILKEEIPQNLPIVTNINVGHALPRCIVPFGVNATVDADKQIITFHYE